MLVNGLHVRSMAMIVTAIVLRHQAFLENVAQSWMKYRSSVQDKLEG
jgi:hypothetical protein